MNYKIFIRTWYNSKGEPEAGRKTHYCYASTEAEAREICRQYNNTHAPGKRSRKAEYERY
jgi:hypothetical protein